MDPGTAFSAEIWQALMLVGGAVLGLLLGFAIYRFESERRQHPAFLKRQPIVVVTLKALDSVADVIGRFRGAEIYSYVIFKGMRYEYDRITNQVVKLREMELLLPPGVIYRTHD